MQFPLFLISLLASFTTIFASPHRRQETTPGFSLAVSKGSEGKKDFIQDFTAARQKWGKLGVAATFSLSEDIGEAKLRNMTIDWSHVANVQVKMVLWRSSLCQWIQSISPTLKSGTLHKR